MCFKFSENILVYVQKNNGPMMVPCGTPKERLNSDERPTSLAVFYRTSGF